MTESTNDKELFRRLLIQARLEKSQELIDRHPEKIEFPPKHLKKMAKIISSSDKVRITRGLSNTQRRIIAVLIAAVMFIFGGLAVYANREAIVEFVKTVFNGYSTVEYETDSDVPETIETEYTMEYVPEGYEKTDEQISLFKVWIQWTNIDETQVIFRQYPLNQNKYGTDNEHTEIEEHILIADYSVYHVRTTYETDIYIWNNGEYSFEISCTAYISEEEITKMIESVKPKE